MERSEVLTYLNIYRRIEISKIVMNERGGGKDGLSRTNIIKSYHDKRKWSLRSKTLKFKNLASEAT